MRLPPAERMATFLAVIVFLASAAGGYETFAWYAIAIIVYYLLVGTFRKKMPKDE